MLSDQLPGPPDADNRSGSPWKTGEPAVLEPICQGGCGIAGERRLPVLMITVLARSVNQTAEIENRAGVAPDRGKGK